MKSSCIHKSELLANFYMQIVQSCDVMHADSGAKMTLRDSFMLVADHDPGKMWRRRCMGRIRVRLLE